MWRLKAFVFFVHRAQLRKIFTSYFADTEQIYNSGKLSEKGWLKDLNPGSLSLGLLARTFLTRIYHFPPLIAARTLGNLAEVTKAILVVIHNLRIQ